MVSSYMATRAPSPRAPLSSQKVQLYHKQHFELEEAAMHLLHCLWGFRRAPWREKLLLCRQDSTVSLCVLFSC